MTNLDAFKTGVTVIARQYGADVRVACDHDMQGAIAFVRGVMERAKVEYLAEFEAALQVLSAAEQEGIDSMGQGVEINSHGDAHV